MVMKTTQVRRLFLVLAAVIPWVLVACVSPSPIGTEESEVLPEPAVAQTSSPDPDFRVIDRGIQGGLSKTAGWSNSDLKVAEPFLSPWPSDFSRKELIDSALTRMYEYVQVQPDGEVARPAILHFEDGLPSEQQVVIQSLTARSMEVIGSDTYPEGVHVVVGQSKYLVDVLNGIKPASFVASFCGNDGAEAGDILFCAGSDIAMIRYGRLIDTGVLESSGSWVSIVPHEIFHTFQDFHREKFGEPEGLGEPIWMSEGSAQFFGYAVTHIAGVSSYYVSPWEWYYYLPNPEVGLAGYINRPPFPYPPEEYWMGQMATEYIVASLGFEALLDIYREYGNSGNFDAAFEAVTELSLAEFYELFDYAYSNLYEKNTELSTFRDRECPSFWGECSFDWGDSRFMEKVVGEVGSEACVDWVSDWWKYCFDSPVPLPKIPENQGHSSPVHIYRITPPGDCSLLANRLGYSQSSFPGLSPTAEIARQGGLAGGVISTQWYAVWSALDSNEDGVICSSAIPESSG